MFQSPYDHHQGVFKNISYMKLLKFIYLLLLFRDVAHAPHHGKVIANK